MIEVTETKQLCMFMFGDCVWYELKQKLPSGVPGPQQTTEEGPAQTTHAGKKHTGKPQDNKGRRRRRHVGKAAGRKAADENCVIPPKLEW